MFTVSRDSTKTRIEPQKSGIEPLLLMDFVEERGSQQWKEAQKLWIHRYSTWT